MAKTVVKADAANVANIPVEVAEDQSLVRLIPLIEPHVRFIHHPFMGIWYDEANQTLFGKKSDGTIITIVVYP